MKLKTFILMAVLSASSLGGCAQRPGPLGEKTIKLDNFCLLYTSPSPRDCS